jgi:tRNA1(Val) A37 N6-methylase TrmN6
LTLDRPAPGVVIAQPERAFRYGSDAMWLTGFALASGPAATALDLGTGSGVVALLLASKGIDAVGIDVREEWAPCWAETLARSAVRGRISLRRADVSEVGGTFELVVSNPPFFAAGTGPVAPDAWKAAARTESTATLAAFVAAAIRVLAPGGRACFVVPRDREREVAAEGLRAARIVRVGRRRSLVRLERGLGADAAPEGRSERDDEVLAWVRAATAGYP